MARRIFLYLGYALMLVALVAAIVLAFHGNKKPDAKTAQQANKSAQQQAAQAKTKAAQAKQKVAEQKQQADAKAKAARQQAAKDKAAAQQKAAQEKARQQTASGQSGQSSAGSTARPPATRPATSSGSASQLVNTGPGLSVALASFGTMVAGTAVFSWRQRRRLMRAE